MSLNEEVELLRRIPLFAKIEASKLKLLAFTSQRLTYKPGDVLFRQGDPGDAAFVIIGGEADIMVDTPGGQLKVAHLKQMNHGPKFWKLCEELCPDMERCKDWLKRNGNALQAIQFE